MRIVFFGTPEFAVPSLAALVDGGYNVVGVVTATDKPGGRDHRMLQSEVKQYAVSKGLNLLQPEKLRDPEFVDQLRALDADLFIVIAFRMMPEVVWQMPRLGTFNLHASLLPKYRGAAPINWAVINGETETGVTTFFLKHEIDTGDIIDQVKIDIAPEDNVGDVYDRLMHLGARLTVDTVDRIIAGTVTTTPQAQLLGDAEPTPAPKIFRDTCLIHLDRPAHEIHNLVRGLSPYPAAWLTITTADGRRLETKIFRTAIIDQSTPASKVGSIYADGDRLFIGAPDHPVEILELRPAGKRLMTSAEFLRGTKI